MKIPNAFGISIEFPWKFDGNSMEIPKGHGIFTEFSTKIPTAFKFEFRCFLKCCAMAICYYLKHDNRKFETQKLFQIICEHLPENFPINSKPWQLHGKFEMSKTHILAWRPHDSEPPLLNWDTYVPCDARHCLCRFGLPGQLINQLFDQAINGSIDRQTDHLINIFIKCEIQTIEVWIDQSVVIDRSINQSMCPSLEPCFHGSLHFSGWPRRSSDDVPPCILVDISGFRSMSIRHRSRSFNGSIDRVLWSWPSSFDIIRFRQT